MRPDTDFEHTTRLGTFVLNSSDRIISKYIFLTDRPFEFDKFARAIDLIRSHGGPSHFDLLIDVGANLGSTCIPALHSGIVTNALAFEPDVQNFKRLQTAIALNDLAGRLSAHNVALSDERQRSMLFEKSATNFGDHRLRFSNANGHFNEVERRLTRVQTLRLDDTVTATPGQRVLLWLDTQGCEGRILSGGPAMLSHRFPMVLEFWPYGLRRTGGFELLKAALSSAPHEQFFDLSDTDPEPHELAGPSLENLHHRLATDIGHTDILVI